MSAQPGFLVMLKVGDGGSPETFSTIVGLRVTGFTHRNQVVDSTNLASGKWRVLNSGAGIRSISITASGTFNDSAAEALVRSYAINSQVSNYQLSFGNGDLFSGPFLVVTYQRTGVYTSPEAYTISLASAGLITFTPGA